MNFFDYYNSLDVKSKRTLRAKVIQALGIAEATFYKWFRERHFPTFAQREISRFLNKPMLELFPEQTIRLVQNDLDKRLLDKHLQECLQGQGLTFQKTKELSDYFMSLLSIYKINEYYDIPKDLFGAELLGILERWLSGLSRELLEGLANCLRTYFLPNNKTKQ